MIQPKIYQERDIEVFLISQCLKLMENSIFDMKYPVVVNAIYLYFQALLERP